MSFFMKTVESPADSNYVSVINQLHYLQVPPTFNGHILYFTLNRQFINGYGWQKGNIATTIGFNQNSQLPVGPQNIKSKNEIAVSSNCTSTPIYEENDNPLVGSNPNTADQQGPDWTITGYVIECTYSIDEDGSDNSSGGSSAAGGVAGGGSGSSTSSGGGTPINCPTSTLSSFHGKVTASVQGCPVVTPPPVTPPVTTTDAEPDPTISNDDPDIYWWTDNTTSYPKQSLPSWANMYANYPKNSSGGDLPGPQVYTLVGGEVLAAYNSDPLSYQNGCALRVSRALNYSGINIPQINGQTYKGSDNKNYFLSSAKLYNFMLKTFGSGNLVLKQSDGGPNGSLFQSKLAGNKGIYIMQAAYPAQFGALGHATLYTGSDCIGGHNYFDAAGGVQQITLWILK